MPKRFARFLAFLAVGAALAGCSSQDVDEAPPIATPSVTLSRSEAGVGTPLDMTYRFEVAPDAPPFTEDYIVFVHVLDADRERMWTDDHDPPIPTRQWKPSEVVEYTRTMFVPKFPYEGPASIEIGLYSRQSGERLPLAGQNTGMRAYEVAAFTMRLESDNLFVIFKDGWHETEVADDGELEWQWSKREGVLAFRNPNRDAELFLQVDQAVAAFDEPQRVEVRHGEEVIDSFVLPAGTRELRRIPLPATMLGEAETVELTVAVDSTFVPADLPSLRSSDPRELGIRVFRAYVAPK